MEWAGAGAGAAELGPSCRADSCKMRAAGAGAAALAERLQRPSQYLLENYSRWLWEPAASVDRPLVAQTASRLLVHADKMEVCPAFTEPPTERNWQSPRGAAVAVAASLEELPLAALAVREGLEILGLEGREPLVMLGLMALHMAALAPRDLAEP